MMTVMIYCVTGILLKCPFVFLARTLFALWFAHSHHICTTMTRGAFSVTSLWPMAWKPHHLALNIKEVNCLSIAMDTERAETGLPEKPGGTNHCNRSICTGDVHDTLRTGTHITAPLSLCSCFFFLSIKQLQIMINKSWWLIMTQFYCIIKSVYRCLLHGALSF